MDRKKQLIKKSEFLYFQFESRHVLTLVYPGTGTRVPPSNENPGFLNFIHLAIILYFQILGSQDSKTGDGLFLENLVLILDLSDRVLAIYGELNDRFSDTLQ